VRIAVVCVVCRLKFRDERLAFITVSVISNEGREARDGKVSEFGTNDFVTDALPKFVDLLSNGTDIR